MLFRENEYKEFLVKQNMILNQMNGWLPGFYLIHINSADYGESNGTPLQCSSLENPRDGGTWWAGVAQSDTTEAT